MNRIWRGLVLGGLAAGITIVAWSEEPETQPAQSGVNCSFQNNPEDYVGRASQVHREILDRITKSASRAAEPKGRNAVPASSIPRANFIDDYIFDKLDKAGVPSAPLAGDEEFVRRIYLDLAGRIPTSDQVREFLKDTNPSKRAVLIDKLVYSTEFNDKWTLWWGDLVANSPNTPTGFNRGIQGRNAFYKWLWMQVSDSVPIKDIAYRLVANGGNTYDEDAGAANFMLNGVVMNGAPIQDTYDMMLVKAATAFLGMGHYDCLLCHNGRGHLDQLSLWGKNSSRLQAQRMAAFFSRANFSTYTFPAGTPVTTQQMSFYFNSRIVTDRTTGDYALNTRFGNRPNRVAIGTTTNLQPEYHFTAAKARNNNWRTEFAENMVKDPMFSKNFANRIWKSMFGMGIAEPVDQLDPARLDSLNPPEDGFAFQATHPELLDALSRELVAYNFGLREFVKLIANSSAYQLSSRYSSDWNLSMVGLFPRHYPRRLDGEEVHDAVVQVSGVVPRYTVQGWGTTISWAMQLQDPQEPRSNGGAANFMNYFLRGNRDTQPRLQAGSIQQQLAMMNDSFVTSRVRTSASPVLQRIAKLTNNNDIVDELYLTFLGRMPSTTERQKSVAVLAKATTAATKNTAIDDLAWALVNKLEFIFSM